MIKAERIPEDRQTNKPQRRKMYPLPCAIKIQSVLLYQVVGFRFRHTGRRAGGHTGIQVYRQVVTQAGGHTGTRADGHTDIQGRRAYRHTDI